MSEVKIPAVGESITSGLISAWHKKEGDQVEPGDALLTLETDKVSTEIAAEEAGILRISAAEGTEVKIGEVVANIEPADLKAKPKRAKGEKAPAEAKSAPAPAIVLPPAPSGRVENAAEPEASPALSNAAAAMTEIKEEAPAGNDAPIRLPVMPESRITRKKLSPLRRKIAAQLVMAQQSAAILTTFNECDMTHVMALRARLQEPFQKQHGVKLGFMSFFIKAAIFALKAVPSVNGRLDGDEFVQNHFYDIGVAVGTDRGLIVPVIRDADRKSFADIEKELVTHAANAREGKIKVEDLQGGVFTVTNGGVYGSLLSTPILNPPQSGILGMHKSQPRPVALDGQVVIRPMMYLALSYDHRVVDGREAVTFLVRVKESIEDPSRLLLEV